MLATSDPSSGWSEAPGLVATGNGSLSEEFAATPPARLFKLSIGDVDADAGRGWFVRVARGAGDAERGDDRGDDRSGDRNGERCSEATGVREASHGASSGAGTGLSTLGTSVNG